jgi:hypothetical protein
MMIMRPPQRGHGHGKTRGSSAAPFSSSASFTGGGTFKSSREAFGKDVDEEASDELMGVQGHRLPAVGSIEAKVFPAERDAVVVGVHEPAVGNSDAMGVAGHIA